MKTRAPHTGLNDTLIARPLARVFAGSIVAFTLAACSDGGTGSTDGFAPGPSTKVDGGSTTPKSSDPLVGFWSGGPSQCGTEFQLAYGLGLCSSKKVSGVEQLAHRQHGSFKWLDEGSYAVSGQKVTITLKRTVVDPVAIRGDVNQATLVLEKNAKGNLEVVSASEMPECTGLELKRTEEMSDADCESGGSGGDEGGCTADADCGSCERCERSTGKCLTKVGC